MSTKIIRVPSYIPLSLIQEAVKTHSKLMYANLIKELELSLLDVELEAQENSENVTDAVSKFLQGYFSDNEDDSIHQLRDKVYTFFNRKYGKRLQITGGHN